MDYSSAKNDSRESNVVANLYEIGLALTSNLDLAAVLKLVGESARRVLRADIAICYLYHGENNTYSLATDVGKKLTPTLNRIPRPEGPTTTIVHTGQPLFSNDAQHEDTPYRTSPFTAAEDIQSVVGLPLTQGDETVGVLYINYRRPSMITDKVLRDAQLLANQAAIAIYNARLFHRLSKREMAMSKLVDNLRRLSEALAASRLAKDKPTIKLTLEEIARTACELLGASCAVVYPYDTTRAEFYDIENIGAWNVEKTFEPKDKPRSTAGMAAYVRREGLVVRNDIATEDPNMLQGSFIKRENIRAFVGVAIGVGDRHFGVLYINWREPYMFTPDDLEMVRLFASQAGVTLQVARLLEQEQNARAALEILDLWNHIGGVFAHRLANIAGPIPVAVRQIRLELGELKVYSPVIDEWLDQVEMDITRLATMADRLHKFREFQGVAEPNDINQILSSVTKHVVKPPIRLVEQYDPALPLISIPKAQINEVFENIVRNAIEAMSTGGLLTVTTKLSGKHWIEVNIADTGPGMDQAKQKQIFDLFYSGKLGGLGFGLWWSRMYMRNIGGDILVQSELGKGTTFTVTVPLFPGS
jgi:signal transduction histidine kinase